MGDLRQLFIFGAIVVLAIAIPATTYIVKQRQDTRSRASETSVTLTLKPNSGTKHIGEKFDVLIDLNNTNNNITGIDFTLKYDQNLLDVTFTPSFGLKLSEQLIKTIDSSTGTIRYVAVDTTKNTNNAPVIPVGALHVTVKNTTGTANIGFLSAVVTGLGSNTALPIGTNPTGTYTIIDLVTTPTVLVSPTGSIPSPTISPVVSPTLAMTPTMMPSITPIISLTPTIIPSISLTSQPASPTPTKPLGDANNDGKIDIADFAVWKTEYLQEILSPSPKTADFNSDSRVDIVDFNIWRTTFLNQNITPTP